jgi:hypothetical protein
MTVSDLARAAKRLAAARSEWQAAVDEAKRVAVAAHEAGASEVELAQALGVDRARTVRRWLGK